MSTLTITSAHTTAQIAGLRRSNGYKALLSAPLNLTDPQALEALGVTFAETAAPVEADPKEAKIQALIDSGAFSRKQATKIVEAQFFTPTATPVSLVKTAPVAPATVKEQADALVAQRGLAHGKGRVYANQEILLAATRVLKGGSPEIVATSGVGRVTHVVVFREDSGDVAVQNLYRPV